MCKFVQAIQFVADSQDEVKSSTLKNWFAKSGLNVTFDNDTETIYADDNDLHFLQH